MSKVLTAVFFAVLSFDVVGALMCHYCQNVMPDNSCFPYLTTCDAESWKYCFTQMTTRGLVIERINRGCSAVCRRIMWKKNQYAKSMLCCTTDFCNTHKFWN